MSTTTPIRVQIVDRSHPHFPEHGVLTGKIIRLITGSQMAEVKLDHCQHGTDACFVSPGQITEELVTKRQGRHR